MSSVYVLSCLSSYLPPCWLIGLLCLAEIGQLPRCLQEGVVNTDLGKSTIPGQHGEGFALSLLVSVTNTQHTAIQKESGQSAAEDLALLIRYFLIQSQHLALLNSEVVMESDHVQPFPTPCFCCLSLGVGHQGRLPQQKLGSTK